MLNNVFGIWLLGGWFAAVAVIVAWSVALDARLSTSGLLLMVGAAPVIVMVLLRAGAASPTVAEILHSVSGEKPNGRFINP